MNILQLCKKMPYPPKDGEAIAILTLTEGWHQAGHQVTLLAITTPKHNFEIEKLPDSIRKIADFDTVFVNTSVTIIDAVANLFTNNSYNIHRFVSNKYRRKLAHYLKNNAYDVIHLEGVYLAPYISTIRKHTTAPIVMRAHNIEFEIWERLAAEQRNPFKKWYMNLLAKRLRRFELESLNKYDALVPISVKDEAFYKKQGFKQPSLTIPASVNLAKYPLDDSQMEFPSLFFIGSLDWMPNQEGLLWFLEKVWAVVHAEFPNLKFYVAGRNIPDWFRQKQVPGLVVVGEVESAIDFMQSKALMIVPLFSGSGMRVKIIEAMALAKPIIATTVAAEGIAYTNEHNILIADTAEAYIEHIRCYVQDKAACTTIGINARSFIEQQHENGVLIERLVKFYRGL